ncbi:hypothetical protein VTN96DRAFT_9258 [Rasamsonia emersonii]
MILDLALTNCHVTLLLDAAETWNNKTNMLRPTDSRAMDKQFTVVSPCDQDPKLVQDSTWKHLAVLHRILKGSEYDLEKRAAENDNLKPKLESRQNQEIANRQLSFILGVH